ncbi:hypothetical protein AB0L40_26000 [Patulibacter sp. NPDC049589]|uniref:hypothetical protein n=1 Tax=Patulibacter sp. NPDC049589 TaxID=3154731 RepID=UPI00344529DB
MSTRSPAPEDPPLSSEELHAMALSLMVLVRALRRQAIQPDADGPFSVPGALEAADRLHEHVVRFVRGAPPGTDGAPPPEVAAILEVVREATGLVGDLVAESDAATGDADPADRRWALGAPPAAG